MTTSPLQALALIYDLEQTLASLRSAAVQYGTQSGTPTHLPQDLMIAAVAFTIQLAIESNHTPDPLRELERELIAHIETAKQDPFSSHTETPGRPVCSTVCDEGRDQIIDLRDTLLAQGDIGPLSVLDQNLLRDCDIALGLVRCKPETREEARTRILKEICLHNQH